MKIELKNSIKSFILQIFILNLFCLTLILAQPESDKATLTGQIIADYGLPISNAELVFDSRYEYIKIKTDENGKYKVKLYPHIYTVRINEWRGTLPYPKDSNAQNADCNSYFRPMQRSRFKLQKKQSAEMNFVLAEVECSFIPENLKNSDANYEAFSVPSHGSGNSRPRYETLLFAEREFNNTQDNQDDLDLMIQFSQRDEKEHIVTYLPANGFRFLKFHSPDFDFDRFFPGVIVTYDLYTIYMNEAKFDRKKKELYGKGKIIVEDGSTRYEVKGLKINLAGNKPEIKLVK